VAEAPDGKPGSGEQGAMVGPARRAEPHGAVRLLPREEIGGEPQRAGSADGLDRGDRVVRPRIAQRQRLQPRQKRAIAFDAKVTLGRLADQQPAFGFLHRPHHGVCPHSSR
jgi:hypothetical protein